MVSTRPTVAGHTNTPLLRRQQPRRSPPALVRGASQVTSDGLFDFGERSLLLYLGLENLELDVSQPPDGIEHSQGIALAALESGKCGANDHFGFRQMMLLQNVQRLCRRLIFCKNAGNFAAKRGLER